jgi:hypothetical protein
MFCLCDKDVLCSIHGVPIYKIFTKYSNVFFLNKDSSAFEAAIVFAKSQSIHSDSTAHLMKPIEYLKSIRSKAQWKHSTMWSYQSPVKVLVACGHQGH